jgi:DNA ligase-1
MRRLAEICERIAGTTKKLEKTAIVADYLKSCSREEGSASATFLSGRPFPMWEETTLQVGGSLLWRVVEELSGKSGQGLTDAYRKYGDLGSVAAAVLPERTSGKDLNILEVQNRFRQIAASRGHAAKTALVRELLSQATPLEAKYIVKVMTGDLRIGLKESLVEEAVAKAFGVQAKEVQRANMLLGDIGETLRFAADNRLSEAKMRLFHPLGFMLASPAASAEEALGYFENALVEDKYDGIRAQAHCSGDHVRIFSRTRDDITESFPELADALAGFPQDVILDGEIVAWSYLVGEPNEPGRALPFSALQKRLGRK